MNYSLPKKYKLGPWFKGYTLKQEAYARRKLEDQSCFFIIIRDGNSFYVEKPFLNPFMGLEFKTPEALMFRLDLWLIEEGFELDDPFVFPDDDEVK